MTMTADRAGSPAGSRPERDERKPRRGSFHSDRQVAYAVKDGKAVTATLATGEKVTGWVFGSDDYHWAIVTTSGETVLVHKSSPALLIHAEPSIDSASDTVKAMVSGYRAAVMRDHFAHTPSRQKD